MSDPHNRGRTKQPSSCQLRAQERRARVMALRHLYGGDWGWQSMVARGLGVSRSTISREWRMLWAGISQKSAL
jgi:hypothetical protein